jgi:hypothetical protein
MRLIALLGLIVATGAVETNEEGKKFLEENLKKDGVKVLDSGVQYKVAVVGYGVWRPKLSANVYVHYEVQTLKGKTVDYTKESLQTNVEDIVVPAIRDVVLNMVQGDEWEIFIPAEQGYEILPDGMQPGDVVKAYVQLLHINSKSKYHQIRTLTCNLRTKEGCSDLELEYATNMYEGQHNYPEAMRGEVTRMTRELNEGLDSKKEITWWEQKIFLMEQLHEMEVVRLRENSPRLEL